MAGRSDESRLAWRQAGIRLIEDGKRMMGHSADSRDRRCHDFSQFQIDLAIGYFRRAARFFARAGSEINRVNVLTMAAMAAQQMNENDLSPPVGAGRPVTLGEMFAELGMRVEREPDHELVHFARYAALGSDDGVESFLREAAAVLGVSQEEILKALVAPEQSMAERVLDSLADGARALGVDAAAAIDPLSAGYMEREKKTAAEITGAGLFGRLQRRLGRDNVILNSLINAARRYNERRRG